MSYIVYHSGSTLYLSTLAKKGKVSTLYGTERAAKAGLTRACKNNPGLVKTDFLIASNDDFHNGIEKYVVRKGILSCAGKEYTVRANTPWTSGPWSETYWCS